MTISSKSLRKERRVEYIKEKVAQSIMILIGSTLFWIPLFVISYLTQHA